MKKIYTQLLLSIFVITGCSSSEDGYMKEQLVGKWRGVDHIAMSMLQPEQDITFISEYRFDKSSEFSIITFAEDLAGNFMGYMSLVEGKYHVNGRSLILFKAKSFETREDQLFDEFEELKKLNSHDYPSVAFEIEFNEKFDFITLKRNCPENALCIKDPELERITSLVF